MFPYTFKRKLWIKMPTQSRKPNMQQTKENERKEKRSGKGKRQGGTERGRKRKSWKVSFAKKVIAAPGALGRGRVEGEEFTHQQWSVWNCLQHEGPEGALLTQSRLQRASQTLTDWPSTIPTPSLWEPGVRTAVFNREIEDDKRSQWRS